MLCYKRLWTTALARELKLSRHGTRSRMQSWGRCDMGLVVVCNLARVEVVHLSTKYDGSNPNRATVGSSGHATGVP
jgi:hypothetical protein